MCSRSRRAGLITEIIDATGDGGNPFVVPLGIAVDGSGNVYVTGRDSDNAFQITPGGAITEIIDATGDGAGNTLDRPLGIAVDGAGNVYVTGSGTDNAFQITPGGVITEIIDATGDGAGNPLDQPRNGIVVDGSGNVYVAGRYSDNAFKFIPGGVITEIIDATGDGAGNPLEEPWDIAVDGAGNIYVAGGDSDNVFKIEFCPPLASSEVVRLGTVPNPNVFSGASGPPILGTTWDPKIDHASFEPGALFDFAGLSTAPADLYLPPWGSLLCALPLFGVRTVAPGTAFNYPIPSECGLVGVAICAQAGSISPAIRLTNALDLILGTH